MTYLWSHDPAVTPHWLSALSINGWRRHKLTEKRQTIWFMTPRKQITHHQPSHRNILTSRMQASFFFPFMIFFNRCLFEFSDTAPAAARDFVFFFFFSLLFLIKWIYFPGIWCLTLQNSWNGINSGMWLLELRPFSVVVLKLQVKTVKEKM